MSDESLLGGLPDLVIALRRDGTLLAAQAGQGVGDLKPAPGSVGRNISEIWPQNVADLLRQLARKAISSRATSDARFDDRGRTFEARVNAQGPDRAICVIRPILRDSGSDPTEGTAENAAPHLDRRGFLQKFKDVVALAALREKPLAVALIHLEGISDIAKGISPGVSEQIMSAALLRLAAEPEREEIGSPPRRRVSQIGQLSDTVLAMVLESSDRNVIEARVSDACNSLRQPVELADNVFHLSPSAGVAFLGQDASSARGLLDRARAAVNEARRGAGAHVCYFTDTLRLRSLARLDIAHELREAIGNREIRLKYFSRHDLATGKQVAWVGYLRWSHPLRGEIPPNEFLRVAETTGLATTLSRAAMDWLQEDYRAFSAASDAGVRISFGALRHHLSHEDFVADFHRLLDAAVIPPDRLELRISEKNLSVRSPGDLQPLAERGVALIVDEIGRDTCSIDWLARAPIQAMQLDRARVLATRNDEVARKFCRASLAVARALGLVSIAAGIDDAEYARCLAELGCEQGSGDLFPAPRVRAASTA